MIGDNLKQAISNLQNRANNFRLRGIGMRRMNTNPIINQIQNRMANMRSTMMRTSPPSPVVSGQSALLDTRFTTPQAGFRGPSAPSTATDAGSGFRLPT